MKKLSLIIVTLLAPVAVMAATYAVPWQTTSTSSSPVYPIFNGSKDWPVSASYFTATSTTATSTFANWIQVTGSNKGVILDNLNAYDSSGIDLMSNNGTQIALLGAGGGANATFYNGLTNYGTFTTSQVNATSTSGTNYFMGNVGIGTTSPAAQLAIQSTSGSGNPLFTIASSTGGTGTTTLLTVLANGNVGVGTTTPGQKLDVYGGNINTSGNVYAGFGSYTAPAFALGGRKDSGMYGSAAGYPDFAFTSGGTSIWSMWSGGVFTKGNTYIGWSDSTSGDLIGSQTNTRLFRDANGIIAQRNSASAQTLRVYNTYTDANNYERGVFDWTTNPNVLSIGTQAGGTGTLRNIALIGGSVGIGTTTPDSTLDVNGSFRLEGASSFITAAISGAIVTNGCDSTDNTGLTGLSSTTAYSQPTPLTTPTPGVTFYTQTISSTTARTFMCAGFTVTPAPTAFVVKIIK